MQVTKQGLTRLELEVMQVIWKRGASSVAEAQQGLGRPLAYTTVQTVLNTLYRKGKLRRRLEGRAFVYTAAVTEARALTYAVRDLVNRMFGGSSEELVMSLIKSRDIDLERLRKLSRQVEAEVDTEGEDGCDRRLPCG